MKTSSGRLERTVRVVCLVAACGVLAGGVSRAQEVVLPSSALPPADVAAELVAVEPRVGLVKWGPFDVIPRVHSSVYYDDNVRSRPDKEDEVVLTVAPGFSAVARDVVEAVGKLVSVDYSPAFVFYTQGRRGDEITHNARLDGTLYFPKLTLGVHQTIMLMSDPDVDVSTRTKRRTYRTGLTSEYMVGEKASVEVNLSYNRTDYEEARFSDRWQVANQNWFNYLYSPKLRMGLGVTVGYLEREGSVNQTFQQALGRVVYAVAEKVSLTVSAGAEVRQFRSSARSDAVNPVWNVTGLYRAGPGTSLSVGIHQQYRSSASLTGQDLLRTGGRVTLRQRVYRQLGMTVSGLYFHSDYRASAAGVVATRVDDSFVMRFGLDTELGHRWTAGLFYDYQNNQSNLERYNYDRHRVGARVAWSY